MVNKIIVCQTGSRHRYLIPQLLEKNKMLKFLYTDSTLYSLCGKLASFMRFLGIKNAMIVRLLKRKPQIDIKHLKCVCTNLPITSYNLLILLFVRIMKL